MTTQEYFDQAKRLDERIKLDLHELASLRADICALSSPGFDERVQSSPNGDAPFVHGIERLMQREEEINREIDLLFDLKEQMRGVIAQLPTPEEQLVLRARVLEKMSWGEITELMSCNVHTAMNWNETALAHAVLPENPIDAGALVA